VLAISRAVLQDADAILALQRLAYQSEAKLYNDWSLPPLTQSLESLLEEFASSVILRPRQASALWAHKSEGCERHLYNRKVSGSSRFPRPRHWLRLLKNIEASFPDASKYELFTGSRSQANIRLYQRHGYTISHTQAVSPTVSLTSSRSQQIPAP